MRFLHEISEIAGHPPVVVLHNDGSSDLNLKVMELGAYDSITHPPNMMELRLILRRAFKFQAAEKEIQTVAVHALTGPPDSTTSTAPLRPCRNCLRWPERSVLAT